MTKRLNSKFGISRKLGQPLWGDAKDPANVRKYPRGMHGMKRGGKTTDFGSQLRAKQTLKLYYNMQERQFRRFFKESARRKGDTGENLVGLLESRLDAFVYRSNLAKTIFEARQLVSHSHFLVNGKKVNIPSYLLKAGDVVSVRDKSQEKLVFDIATESSGREVPHYIERDAKLKSATYVKVPAFEEIPYPVQIHLNFIVEFYSR